MNLTVICFQIAGIDINLNRHEQSKIYKADCANQMLGNSEIRNERKLKYLRKGPNDILMFDCYLWLYYINILHAHAILHNKTKYNQLLKSRVII